jgi:hypothetical protein
MSYYYTMSPPQDCVSSDILILVKSASKLDQAQSDS